MNNQRINCRHCGKPLVNGIYYAVAGIQCTCGHYNNLSKMRQMEEDDDWVYKGKAKARTPYKRERGVCWRGRVDI